MVGALGLIVMLALPLIFVLGSQKSKKKLQRPLICRCFGTYATLEKDEKTLCSMCHREKKKTG